MSLLDRKTNPSLRSVSTRRHRCTIKDELQMREHKAALERGEPGDPSWLTREDEVPEPCAMCQGAWARRLALTGEEGKVLPFYVVAYGIERCWGGPEEGGWWQDWTRILEVRKVWTFRQGLRAVRMLREEYPTCARGRGSVLGEEDVFVRCYYTSDMFPTETTERMRYE